MDQDRRHVDRELGPGERPAQDPLDHATAPEAGSVQGRADERADDVDLARSLDAEDVAQVRPDRVAGGDAVEPLGSGVPVEDGQLGIEDADGIAGLTEPFLRTLGLDSGGRGRTAPVPLTLEHAGYRTLAFGLGRSGRPEREEDQTLSWAMTEEERLLRDTAREFARRVVAPTAVERDEAERFERGIFAEMGALGLAGAPLPESVGGGGFSYLGWSLVMEEIGAADMASAVTLSVHILSQYPVVTWGTPEQHERWLAPMVTGSALGAFALTEPHAGSDAAAIRTRAERVGPADAPEGYRLSGTKIWISNAPEADRYLVFATVDPARGSKGIAAFLVEKGMDGFEFGAHEKKMGIRACPAAELVFDGCFVPIANRLGSEGDGYRIALSALAEGRISIAAACVGIARSALESAAAYSASGRRSAGRSRTSRRSGSSLPRWPGTSRRPGR